MNAIAAFGMTASTLQAAVLYFCERCRRCDAFGLKFSLVFSSLW